MPRGRGLTGDRQGQREFPRGPEARITVAPFSELSLVLRKALGTDSAEFTGKWR